MNLRKLALLILLSSFGFVVATGSIRAQGDMPEGWADYLRDMTPGPEHQELQKMVGSWVTKTTMTVPGQAPDVTWGLETWKSVLGGRFVEANSSGMMMGQPTASKLILGYDRTRKVYTSVAFTTTSTGMMITDGKTMEDGSIDYRGMIYEWPTPKGRPFRVVTKNLSPDHYRVIVYDSQPNPENPSKMIEVQVVEIHGYRQKSLFKGKTLDQWDRVACKEGDDVSKTWSVKDGVIVCHGKPAGYIRSKKAYKNYQMDFEWRWVPGSKGGNSGLLIHTTKENELWGWPKSLEAQLQAGSAGDFWQIGETITVKNQKERQKGRRIPRTASKKVEKPIGEWNHMKVHSIDGAVKVWVNGVLVNEGTNCSATSGKLSLQSEGTEIHFRNIMVAEM